MEKQLSFSDMEKSGRKRVTRREKFLRQMNAIIPWEAWVELIRLRPMSTIPKLLRP